MKQNIKVSVITPVHNDALFLYETLKSILNQTYSNLEVLIVDDASTDNSVGIIKNFNDSRIRLFVNKTNKGAAYSRNLALKHVTGDYVAFLDGDDLWALDKIEKQLDFMLRNEYVFSYTKYITNINGNNVKLITGPKVITHKMFMKTDYVGCLTVMYKKTINPNLRIPDSILKRNDYALWLILSEKSNCYLLEDTLATYRKHKNGISSGSKYKLIKYYIILYKKLYGFSYLKCYFYTFLNTVYYFYKFFRYIRKIKKD